MAERLTAKQVAAHNARSQAAWSKLTRTTTTTKGVVAAKPARTAASGPQRKASGRKMGRGYPDYEEMLAGQLKLAGVTGFVRQYRFCAGRRYRADFFFPDRNLIVEIEGQVHAIKGRWKASFERDQVIFFLLIRLLKVSTAQVRGGEALSVIERALKAIPPYPKL